MSSIRVWLMYRFVSDAKTISQVRIEAFDSEFPATRASTDVIVNVERNPSAPVFSPDEARSVTISDRFPVGGEVVRLLATDADGVSHHSLPSYRITHRKFVNLT